MPVHAFVDENPARRQQVIRVIRTFRLLVHLYQADRPADRHLCLQAIVRDIAPIAERLVIERDESTLSQDRRALHEARDRFGCFDTLRWDLLVPKTDPLLWIPDAVVWSWVRGGQWRHAVSSFCELREL
jgi:hypothetical protein